MFRFNATYSAFMDILSECRSERNVQKTVDDIQRDFIENDGADFDKKSCLDHALRRRVAAVAAEVEDAGALEHQLRATLQLSVSLARVERCSPTTPIVLLSDSFDALSLDGAQALFAFVEENVATWKEETFFNACKNNLLRMCNDLLRRLSRSQNTVFCGRILLFLAKFFPLSERSGLNVISEFNLDNLTAFGDGGEEMGDSEAMETEEEAEEKQKAPAETTGPPLDYNLYRKFWALQDFFRNPNQCYSKVPWKAFNSYTSDVLAAFSGFKLEESAGSQTSQLGTEEYFAKYLTSQKLLHLQLSDPMFRRYVLVQFLILFQYLTTQVKFKSEAQALTDPQAAWVKETTETVYRLMAETPPHGARFSETMKVILKNEENWSGWKNDGCPAFKQPVAPAAEPETTPGGRPAPRRRPKRKVGDVLRHAESKNKYLMGHPELTRIWNVCPDNLEACKSTKRDFLPPLDAFFDTAIMQMDPASMVEDKYKVINDGDYGWRALRLLARRSPHFFAAAQKIPNSLPDYLETILKKVAHDIPKYGGATGNGDAAVPAAEETVADGAAEAEELRAEEPAEEAPPPARRVHPVTEPLASQLAAVLGEHWKRLASRLGFQSDEVDYFVSEHVSAEAQAAAMFRQWMDNEREEASQEELLYALEAVKLDARVRHLFDAEVRGEEDPSAGGDS